MARTSVSRVQQFVKGFETHLFFIGIDVHKRSYHLALRRIDGKTVTLVCPADPSGLVGLIQRLCIPVGSIAYEAGPTGFGLCRVLRQAGMKTLMAARAGSASGNLRGQDRPTRLPSFGRLCRQGMIRSIAVPSARQEAQRSLLSDAMTSWTR